MCWSRCACSQSPRSKHYCTVLWILRKLLCTLPLLHRPVLKPSPHLLRHHLFSRMSCSAAGAGNTAPAESAALDPNNLPPLPADLSLTSIKTRLHALSLHMQGYVPVELAIERLLLTLKPSVSESTSNPLTSDSTVATCRATCR